MADKYTTILNGVNSLVEGTVSSAGAADAGKIPALASSGRLDPTLMPEGIGADTATGTAFESLVAGNFAYIRSDGQVARASAASGGNAAAGFVLAASAAAAPATVYFEGRNTGLSGLTPGARYYLSDSTPGGATATPVTGTGKKHQFLGTAVTATSLSFEGDDFVAL